MWLSRRSLPQKYVQIQNHQTKSRKSRVHPQKRGKTRKKATRTSGKQKRRLRTNKRTDSEHGANSDPGSDSEHRTKKEGCAPLKKYTRCFVNQNPIVLRIIHRQNFPHPRRFFGFNTSCFWRWNVLYLYRDMGGASAPPFFRHFPFKIGDFRSASG